ncbi:hypothetical protein CKF43_21110 [Pantoea graminicola]|nr:hypothetical protein CKF43_21110 [Pantoea sp. ARC607]
MLIVFLHIGREIMLWKKYALSQLLLDLYRILLIKIFTGIHCAKSKSRNSYAIITWFFRDPRYDDAMVIFVYSILSSKTIFYVFRTPY